jgi:hypothetical protein
VLLGSYLITKRPQPKPTVPIRAQQPLNDQEILRNINGYVSDLEPAVNVSFASLVLPDGSMLNHIPIRNLSK